MRQKLAAMVIALALNSSWAQEALDADTATTGGLSAYDIFGLSSLSEEESSSTTAPVEALASVEETTATDSQSTDTESVAVDDGEAEDTSKESDTPILDDEIEAGAALGTADESVESSAGMVIIDASGAEGGLGYSADEEVLLAEITRLLAERDELYSVINELYAENLALREQTSDANYYKERTAELEAEIAKLENVIEEKNAALAFADNRLAEMEALLAEEGAKLDDAESRLATAGGDEDALGGMIAAKDALIAERDAVISGKDDALALKEDEIEARDRAIKGKDEDIATLSARLEAADAELVKAKADLLVAEAYAREVAESAIAEQPDETGRAAAEAPVETGPSVGGATEAVLAAERRIAALTGELDAALESKAAAEKAREVAEASRLEAEAALSAATAAGSIVPGHSERDAYLAGWRLDTSKFTKKLRDGFDGSSARLGSWSISGATASQSDASQYFSRLEMPLAQGKLTTLYRFRVRSTGKGWVGLGLHLFVDNVKKKHGYGEGKSLLVWFTRDKAARGDDATYVQLYRSDDDVVMERMFDAELADGLDSWRFVEIVYDPGAEYIAVSVDGSLRIVYRTFFGRDSGATVSLRTLGGGAAFSDFSAWSE